jgi:non-heme chloroperoxidase
MRYLNTSCVFRPLPGHKQAKMTVADFQLSNRITLRADVLGRDHAPPVLFTHGGGQTRQAWQSAVHSLSDQFRVINLDLRGHGESSWAPDGDYGLDAFVDDLRGVIAETTTGPIDLVGASMGGIISLVVAGEKLAQVRRLVLVDVVPRVEPAGADRIKTFMLQHQDGFATLEDAAEVVAAYTPGRAQKKSLSGLQKNLRKRKDGRYYWHWDPKLSSPTGFGAINYAGRLDAAAAKLDIPVLLVRGMLSDVVSDRGVASFHALTPHLRIANIADASHMVAGDRNDVFAEVVQSFLEE